MNMLSAVSETALITSKAHVVESETANPVIEDVVSLFKRKQSGPQSTSGGKNKSVLF